jgi:glyoxylase-like metal-dependent hydrolase (beta-lactamase superfamily II)
MTAPTRFPYTRGLHELGNGCFAFLQPDGGWGWSNAGLVTDAGASLLVDTLFDLALTREMLAAMRRATPAAARIGALVNTHANGDHCYGNVLVRDAEIIASKATAEEMAEVPPALMQRLLENAEQLGPAGAFFRRVFGAFDFRGIEPALPTRTFERELTLPVGGKSVRLLEVGPAHTRGDVLVHSPEDRIVFTGDILFIEGTPIVWEGPVANWIRACERIEAMDVDVVVPGHGPITDRGGARRVREYLAFVQGAARERFDAGLSARDAAHDIDLGAYADWRDAERIAVNVETVYRELRGGGESVSPLELFGRMAELARR